MPDQADDDSLFVRVEGYRLILQDLEAVRQILENMREAVSVLNQLQDVKERSIETFFENLDRLNAKMESIDQELPEVREVQQQGKVQVQRPQPETGSAPQQAPEEAVDDSIRDLHSELSGLKDELDNL